MHDQPADPYHTISELVGFLNRTDHLRRQVQGWNRTILLTIDGEHYLIHTGDDLVRSGRGEPDSADLGFTMSGQTFRQIVAQQTTPLAAKLAGKIASEGNLVEILRFASILSNAIKEYREVHSHARDSR